MLGVGQYCVKAVLVNVFKNLFLGQDYPGQEVCSALSGCGRCSFSLPWLQKREAGASCPLAPGKDLV